MKILEISRHIWCMKASQSAIIHIREGFTPELKRSFKEAMAELLKVNTSRYQIHHIIPISFMGRNEFDNFCLIQPEIHDAFHRFIEENNRTLKPNEKGYILLPHPRSRIVLNRNFNF